MSNTLPNTFVRTWTKIGEEHTGEPEARKMFDKELNRMRWQDIQPGAKLPLGQGMAVNQAVKEFNLRNVTKVALYGGGNELNVYGIQFGEATTRRLYIADNGVECCPIAFDTFN